jgi:hypothetical protein
MAYGTIACKFEQTKPLIAKIAETGQLEQLFTASADLSKPPG